MPNIKKKCVIVDIDGTVADRTDRGPYDWDRVLEDDPKMDVIAVVQALNSSGYVIVFVSGRMEQCWHDTYTWIINHVGFAPSYLKMRPDGDYRKDYIIKEEIYNEYIKPRFDVVCVIDDRDSVVRMWRSLGLTCLQVSEGNF